MQRCHCGFSFFVGVQRCRRSFSYGRRCRIVVIVRRYGVLPQVCCRGSPLRRSAAGLLPWFAAMAFCRRFIVLVRRYGVLPRVYCRSSPLWRSAIGLLPWFAAI